MWNLKLDKSFISKKLLTDFSWTVLAKAVAMIGFFALDIAMARLLGKDSYGEWSFFYSAIIMLSHICWFGINASVKVSISKQITKEKVSDCLKASLKLRLVISLIFFFIVSFSSGILRDYLESSSKYENLHILMYGAGALIFLSSFSEFYKALSIGMQCYRNLFLVTFMEYGGYLVFSIIAVLVLKNNTGVLAGYIMAGIFTLLLGYTLIRTHFVKTDTEISQKRHLQREILMYAMPLLVTSIGEILLVESDTFFLGIFSIPAQVSIYSISKKLCAKVHHINYTFCVTVLPQFSMITSENYKEKYDKFRKYGLMNILLSICVAVGLFITGDIIIDLLYGNEYSDAKIIFKILLIFYLQHSISYYFALFLEFQKKAAFESICYFVTIVLNVALEIWLVPLYGAYGAAISTILSFIPYTILIIFKAVKILKSYYHIYENEKDG